MPDYGELAQKTHIAILHETVRESIARDLSTVAIYMGLWSVGHFAESAALEWAGVMLASIVIVSRAMLLFKGVMDKRMTPDQARKWLDTHFPIDKETPNAP